VLRLSPRETLALDADELAIWEEQARRLIEELQDG
jgi:hypothetical protein